MGPEIFKTLRKTLGAMALCTTLFYAPTQAQANSLSSELLYLLENYPAIRAKASLSDAAREDIKAAYALSAPVLAINGDTGTSAMITRYQTTFVSKAI